MAQMIWAITRDVRVASSIILRLKININDSGRKSKRETKESHNEKCWWDCDVMCLLLLLRLRIFLSLDRASPKKNGICCSRKCKICTRFLFWFITILVYSCSTFRHQAISHHKLTIHIRRSWKLKQHNCVFHIERQKKSLPKRSTISFYFWIQACCTPPSPSAQLQAILMILQMITKTMD